MSVSTSSTATDASHSEFETTGHRTADGGIARAPAAHAVHFETEDPSFDLLSEEASEARETFLPVTRAALTDRLTRPQAWPNGDAKAARRFFKYLTYWR